MRRDERVTDAMVGVAAKLELWFFRDMFQSNRLALFSLFGFKNADLDTMGKQQKVFRHIISSLSAALSEQTLPVRVEAVAWLGLGKIYRDRLFSDRQMAQSWLEERDGYGTGREIVPLFAHPPVSALVNAQADADVVGDSELNRRAFALARQAYDRKWADISSPAPTEEPDAGDGPLGYAIRAYLSAAPTDWYDVEDRRVQKLATVVAPDNGTPHEVLSAVLECARAWVPEARIIGNVRAGDIARAVTAALFSLRPADVGSATETIGGDHE